MGRPKAALVLTSNSANSSKAWLVRDPFRRIGDAGQDYLAECFWEDEPADSAPVGTDKRHGWQMAAALPEVRGGRITR